MIGLIIATTGPRRPYVTIILSIPVCGVDNKKDVIEPLDAPCFFNDAETGITEHEHKGSGTPNIHTINLNDSTINQNTDVGEAIWTHQLVPNDSTIFSTTLSDVDTIRVMKVSPKRKIGTDPLSIMDSYSNWLKVRPVYNLDEININENIDLSSPNKYNFTKHFDKQQFLKDIICINNLSKPAEKKT